MKKDLITVPMVYHKRICILIFTGTLKKKKEVSQASGEKAVKGRRKKRKASKSTEPTLLSCL